MAVKVDKKYGLPLKDAIIVKGIDSALQIVREKYPDAYVEGSTGYSKSFWVRRNNTAIIVAAINPRNRKGDPLTEMTFDLFFAETKEDKPEPGMS